MHSFPKSLDKDCIFDTHIAAANNSSFIIIAHFTDHAIRLAIVLLG
jgi:hypothetical protein